MSRNPLINKSINLPLEYIKEVDFNRNLSNLNESREPRAVSFSMEEFPPKIYQTVTNSISLNNRLSNKRSKTNIKNSKKNYSMIIT